MPARKNPLQQAPDYLGFVEEAGGTSIQGWAIDRARLPQPAQVALLGSDGPIAIARADRPRPDVAQAGFPSAACGFHLRVPTGAAIPPCVVFWPDRVPVGAVKGLALRPPPPAPIGRQLGLVTSWHEGCGIAEYAREVVRHLASRFTITVFARDATTPLPAGAARIDTCWQNNDTGLDLLCERLAANRPDILLVEHHPGLLAWPRLAALIEQAHASGIAVHVRLHTWRSSLQSLRQIRPALRLCAAILVHTENDLACITSILPGLRVHRVPHGIPAPPLRHAHPAPKHPRKRGPKEFHIGAFGFMHAYKGIAEHLHALHLLRRHLPEVRATLLHALTDDPATAATAVECFALRHRLGLDDAVTIDTRLLPMDTVATRLSSCDILVFPYQDSAESASGAACALASLGVPLLSTPSAIFADLQAVCHVTSGADSYAIASKLRALATDRRALRATLPRLAAYARANAWPSATDRLANLLSPAE